MRMLKSIKSILVRNFTVGSLAPLFHVGNDSFAPVYEGDDLVVTASWLYKITMALLFGALLWGLVVKLSTPEEIRGTLQNMKVAKKKMTKTVTEIKRKTFHATGLLAPVVYQLLLAGGWSVSQCAVLFSILTLTWWIYDVLRINSTFVQNHIPSVLESILRIEEKNRLCGCSYFSLGCTLAVLLFPPSTAVVSVVWLVLGDMSAALVGRAYGGEAAEVKVGRSSSGPFAKKSLEGSFAMFLTCFVTGLIIFWEQPLAEYAVFLGALAATAVELYEPFGLNDNLTIPLVSGFVLSVGFIRLNLVCLDFA